MNDRPSRLALARALTILVMLGLALIGPRAGLCASPTESPAPVYDCGPCSLYTLLCLEGRQAPLPVLGERLGESHPDGYSMRDLRDAARASGVVLTGSDIGKNLHLVDRPIIVLLRSNSHGHYVVVRPVGHTGKLVQMFDPNRMPVVLDSERLIGRSEWTGLALIPARPNWPARIAGGFAGVAALTLLLTYALPRRRRPALPAAA